jgi:hypothetical protein
VFHFVLGPARRFSAAFRTPSSQFRSHFIERNLINCAIRRGTSGWALSYLPSLFSFLLTQWECKGTTTEISGAGDAHTCLLRTIPPHRDPRICEKPMPRSWSGFSVLRFGHLKSSNALRIGKYQLELLFPKHPEIVERIRLHPALVWKAQNITQYLAQSKKPSQLSLHRAAELHALQIETPSPFRDKSP